MVKIYNYGCWFSPCRIFAPSFRMQKCKTRWFDFAKIRQKEEKIQHIKPVVHLHSIIRIFTFVAFINTNMCITLSSPHMFAFLHCFIFVLFRFSYFAFSHCNIIALLHFRIILHVCFFALWHSRIVIFSHFRVPFVHTHGDITLLICKNNNGRLKWPR
jgi:hypothetical protein